MSDSTESTSAHGPPHLDVDRWDRLIENLGPESILVVIGRWMSDRIRAHFAPEDIWQETLFHAWRDRESHEWVDARKYRAWLFAIAKNRIRDAADYLEAKKRGGGQAATPFGTLVGSRVGSVSAILPGRSTTPSMIASVGERARKMDEALSSLDEDCADVVRLHLFEERPMQSVAEELAIPESTAWYRFRKGARQYAERLGQLDSRTREP